MKYLILAGVAATVLTIPAFAIPTVGTPVDKIRFANQIDGWNVINDRAIVLEHRGDSAYLVNFKTPCHGLRFAFNIGVSSSANTVYANFDYVLADNVRCSIESIQRITDDEVAVLKS